MDLFQFIWGFIMSAVLFGHFQSIFRQNIFGLLFIVKYLIQQ